MKSNDNVGFPNLGEIFHFLVKSAGVLPAKRDQTPDFDDTKRNTLRKLLERLANEEGSLRDNSNEAFRELGYLVAGYVRCTPVGLAIGEVICELLDVYGHVLKDEGTYLSKRDTLQWMIAERWAPAIAMAIARAVTQFGLRSLAAYFPDAPRWYLPDIGADRVTWPLTKVMRWIYAQSGSSQMQFHSPSDEKNTDGQRERDLENAQNWSRGGNPPSAAALAWAFERGFQAREFAKAERGSPAERYGLMYMDGAQMALFLARWATYAGKKFERTFGREALQIVCQAFERTLDMAMEEASHVETMMAAARERGLPLTEANLRQQAVEYWNQELRERIRMAAREAQALHEAGALHEREIERMLTGYGRLAVLPLTDALRASAHHVIPPGFGEALLEGEALSKDRGIDETQIDEYEAGLKQTGMDACLPWMVPWLRFQVCYRRRDDTAAWGWIAQAYEAARYRAGGRQYQILNHYLELAAKMGREGAFRKAVLWADYVDLQVRWLRDKEITPQNLADAMEMLRIARYPV
jgi:hypothetical protein